MISAIILAAGESKRMGQPKMLLPWGRSTVLQTVLQLFRPRGLKTFWWLLAVRDKQVDALIGQTVQTVFNENYRTGRDVEFNPDWVEEQNARGTGRAHRARRPASGPGRDHTAYSASI